MTLEEPIAEDPTKALTATHRSVAFQSACNGSKSMESTVDIDRKSDSIAAPSTASKPTVAPHTASRRPGALQSNSKFSVLRDQKFADESEVPLDNQGGREKPAQRNKIREKPAQRNKILILDEMLQRYLYLKQYFFFTITVCYNTTSGPTSVLTFFFNVLWV